jgi:Dolichyl-phosphate-mannose-protein mannosyltransferase
MLLGVVSLAYLAGAAIIAMRRPLWNDELYTLLIARSATMSDVWAALATGADQVPPPFQIITRASLTLFGMNRFALRVPEVLGFWLMGICLYRFVLRRVGGIYAIVTMSFPLVSGAYNYAHEGRAYSLVLGIGALALLFWQTAGDESRRQVSLVGLATSVAAAVCSHYYAVLLSIPLGLAEGARWLAQKRWRPGVPIALAVGLAPLAWFLPLIVAARSYSVHFWATPSLSLVPSFYYWVLLPASPALWAILALAALYSLPQIAAFDPPPRPAHDGLEPAELSAALAFAGLPLIAVLIALAFTGVFTLRYALPAIIGVAILAGAGMHGAFAGRRGAGLVLIALFLGWFLGLEARALNAAGDSTRRGVDCERLLASAAPSLPIAVADPHTFLKLAYELPPQLRTRVVYLADPDAALRHLGYDTVDRGLFDLEPWFGVHVEPFHPFLETTPRFLLLARTSDDHGEIWGMGWILAELATTKARCELVGRNTDDLLFLVETAGR